MTLLNKPFFQFVIPCLRFSVIHKTFLLGCNRVCPHGRFRNGLAMWRILNKWPTRFNCCTLLHIAEVSNYRQLLHLIILSEFIFLSGPPQKVRLGSVNLHDSDDFVEEIIIDHFVNHPEYKRPRKYHDIAIMFLKKLVTFTAFVRPACLNTVEHFRFIEARASGFGLTTHGM